jgi:glycolate oxidase
MSGSVEPLAQLRRLLREKLGSRFVLERPEELATYECDACTLLKHPPQLVALPRTTEEVAFIVQTCQKLNIPYTARGAGTGLSGGALPVEGGLLIGLNRLDRIVVLDVNNRIATVEVGVVNARLNQMAHGHGLFYAPDPSSQAACSLGGNIAENAGGIHCLKYGVTTDHVLALQVVLPNGETVWLGSKNRRSHGPNLTGLMVGSEGTLGIVTQAVLRLLPLPQLTRVYLAAFASLESAGATVSAIIKSGMLPAALEFMDAFTVRAVNIAFSVGFPEEAEAVLLIELDGSPGQVAHDEARLHDILQVHDVRQVRVGETLEERAALWKSRKATVAAYGRFMPAFYLHDCVIPRSRLVPILQRIQQAAKEHDVLIANVFHAGDGNLHPHVLFDPADPDMVRRGMTAGDEILHACIQMGGALSGEHGVGLEKMAYMPWQFSPESLERMRSLKRTFDPNGLTNPGKMFPQRAGCGEARVGVTPPVMLIPSNAPDAGEEGVWV